MNMGYPRLATLALTLADVIRLPRSVTTVLGEGAKKALHLAGNEALGYRRA
ncbi:MAG: hypothetical protein WA862_08320 [Solirubrobacterales bacterium]